MKKLLILSGKGGTGKTTIASAFIRLLNSKSFADCDVDAPNLHITVKPEGKEESEYFYGLPKAEVDTLKCTNCYECVNNCRFGAINIDDDKICINEFKCEGCGVCAYICQEKAITMKKYSCGETIVYHGNRHFSTAKLKMGAGASGKLVSEVKRNMQIIEDDNEIAIIDGSPGIGCPVIASISGVDMVLIVTEPTVSGISDLKRIMETVKYFKTKCAVCINKYDINKNNTEEIRKFCKKEKISIVGILPFDKSVSKAVNDGITIVDIDCVIGKEVKFILDNTLKILNEESYNGNVNQYIYKS